MSLTTCYVTIEEFNACIAALESEKILTYLSFALRLFASSNITSLIAMSSAWKTVASSGSRLDPSRYVMFPLMIVYPEPTCSSVLLHPYIH